jgi:putative SOS response-associated peptidase YedK
MCGRYGFTYDSEDEFKKRFLIGETSFDLVNNYNVAPTHEMPVIERHSPNSVHLRKWGIQPSWSPMTLINSKIEKLTGSRFWQKPFTTSRVIIPASYFIEWQKLEDGKQAYVIRPKSKDLFGFAGLLVSGIDKNGIEQTGYTIITQEAGKFMNRIHHRQPSILRKDDEDAWLNPDNVEPENLLKLLAPYPYDVEMEMYPVSSLVNTPKNNFPEVIKPLDM